MKARHLPAVLFSRTRHIADGLAGAFADPCSEASSGGTQTPSPRRPKLLLLLAATAALAALVLGVSLASAAAPTVTIEDASAVRYTTATAKGEVTPASGEVGETFYRFQYATQAQFEASEWGEAESTSEESFAEGAGPTPVQAELTGLHPGTTYHLRLAAFNREGEERDAVAPSTFTTEAVAPPIASIEPVTTVGATSVQVVGHVNPNAPNAEGSTDAAEQGAFRTEWHFVCTPACPGLSGGTIEADDTSHEVTAETTELPAGSRSYEVKLVASNAGGETVAGPIPFTTPSSAPTIESSSAFPGAREAEFTASINPGNLATTYRFEFGPTAAYVRSTETATIPAGSSPVSVIAKVSGLEPSTTYHFRVIAQNGKGPAETADQEFTTAAEASPQSCPNEQLRSESHSLGLPDCRAYEMVTPPFKFGDAPGSKGVSADGSIAFFDLGNFAEPAASNTSFGAAYVDARGDSGWLARPVNPSAQQFRAGSAYTFFADSEAGETTDFSPDLSRTLFSLPPLSAKPIDFRIYRRETATGAFTEIGPINPPARVAASTEASLHSDHPSAFYDGATADFSHVLFSQSSTFAEPEPWYWPGDSTVIGNSMYEYTGAGASEPRLVGIAPGAEERKALPSEDPTLASQCGIVLGGGERASTPGVEMRDTYNAISSSGATIFFTALKKNGQCFGEGPPVNELFARVGGTETVAISEPSAADCAACDISTPSQALFQGASSDGSKVFFLSEQALLPGAAGDNLYEYDFASPAGQKVRLIATQLASAPNEPLSGVVRVSEDGSRVYFASEAILTPEPNQLGRLAEPGRPNLYVYDTGTGHIAFIATMSAGDSSDWTGLDTRTVETTEDGRFLLFRSMGDLTPDALGSANQIYRYDAQSGALVRISIGEGGLADDGNAATSFGFPARSYQGAAGAAPHGVSISTDGSEVFFGSPAALTPTALNESCAYEEEGSCQELASNVYEYRDGHVYLLSDGRDTKAVFRGSATHLIGADPSGRDVFFQTADPLVASDGDTQADIYDARAGGGLPAAASPEACSGEACQGASSPSPGSPPAASAVFSGPGNPGHPRRHKKKHHKKHHHGKSTKDKRHAKRRAADTRRRAAR